MELYQKIERLIEKEIEVSVEGRTMPGNVGASKRGATDSGGVKCEMQTRRKAVGLKEFETMTSVRTI